MTNSTYQLSGSLPLAAVMAGLALFTSASEEQPMSTPERRLAPEVQPSYVPGNTGMKIRVSVVLTGDSVVDNYKPRTELGRKLLALRRAYVMSGGKLLDGEAMDAEMRLRRGGVADA
jgi:hypothetical protein